MSTTVNFRALRKNLATFLRQAHLGDEIVVTSRGVEVARIVPPVPSRRRPVGLLKGHIQMEPDFDLTPPDIIDIMEGEEG